MSKNVKKYPVQSVEHTCRFQAWCLAVALSMAIKLVACAMQQVLLGKPLGRCVWGQKLVGVDQPVVRAMEVPGPLAPPPPPRGRAGHAQRQAPHPSG